MGEPLPLPLTTSQIGLEMGQFLCVM
jgi:hypothetical protein